MSQPDKLTLTFAIVCFVSILLATLLPLFDSSTIVDMLDKSASQKFTVSLKVTIVLTAVLVTAFVVLVYGLTYIWS